MLSGLEWGEGLPISWLAWLVAVEGGWAGPVDTAVKATSVCVGDGMVQDEREAKTTVRPTL